MFIYSLRASTIKLVGVVCVALTVLITLIVFVPTYAVSSQTSANPENSSYSYDKVKSAEDAASFLAQFGWQVEATPTEV
jgi:surface polysaccharide O-acyltransferase-like enzyme